MLRNFSQTHRCGFDYFRRYQYEGVKMQHLLTIFEYPIEKFDLGLETSLDTSKHCITTFWGQVGLNFQLKCIGILDIYQQNRL